MKLGRLLPKGLRKRKERARKLAFGSTKMAKKVKIPKRVDGIKIKKRHRRQLKALIRGIEKYQELVAIASALLALLGVTKAAEAVQTNERGPATAH